ncbi:Acyl-CoA synthetase (AMP-forming)/AMP-acid ligase II [Actinacidiphila guanduensis]|uniref:Acyl-CoA synthetase (AMP-forming)/AMP-acid ligase II n=2 Tax=Actinacidiphila guanduensis TaxID=310781 RepID=A0A1H0SAQ1_9ACTN|nr:Acyl-CoA synthetase (AMP-forming)/AMP-acid ligase II [Actinacidiphila guanduensis]
MARTRSGGRSPADTLDTRLSRAARLHPDDPAFTFVDFAAGQAARRTTMTWSDLDHRVSRTADALRAAGCAGERVAVVAPQGPAYVVGFLAVLRAASVAIPLFPPDLAGNTERLAAVLRDADPGALLTAAGGEQALADFCAERGVSGTARVLAVDALDALDAVAPPAAGGPAPGRDAPAVRTPLPDDCAYLQYTSGSTRSPSGVEITHANLLANVDQAVAAYEIHRERNQMVSWLPFFHDMGLVLALAIPVARAVHAVVMEPAAFVQHPVRWLQLLSDHPGAVTAAPNFAYDYCVRRVAPGARPGLALDRVSVMINGSEPVRSPTLAGFQREFLPCGLSPHALRPSYGLAEATVFVATAPAGRAPQATAFDRAALRGGKLRPASGDGEATELVSCGTPVGQELVVVDPATRRPLGPDEIGEIWVRGPNVARGYWRQPVLTAEVFGAHLADGPAQGVQTGGWLRTGDLGAVHHGALHVTGRIKDLVILDGVNHYPQDIEATVQEAHALIRTDHVAAFSLTVDTEERLVVVAEHSRQESATDRHRAEVARAVRQAVAVGHGVSVHDFVLAAPGTVPRTTSGKVSRSACRTHYLAGAWSAAAMEDVDAGGSR